MIAARIIVAIENPEDIMVVSQRPYGSRAVLKFSQHVGSAPLAGRWTPGTLTNYITKKFREPRLFASPQEPGCEICVELWIVRACVL